MAMFGEDKENLRCSFCGKRREQVAIAGDIDGAHLGAGLAEDPHILATEAAEGPGHDRHLVRQAEHAAEQLIAYLFIIQLFRVT